MKDIKVGDTVYYVGDGSGGVDGGLKGRITKAGNLYYGYHYVEFETRPGLIIHENSLLTKEESLKLTLDKTLSDSK